MSGGSTKKSVMKTILSTNNSKLKAVRALVRSKKERLVQSRFVMEGVRALKALVDALPQYTLREIWLSDQADMQIPTRFAMGGTPLFQISHEMMEQLSDCQTSQGILGVVDYAPPSLVIQPERGKYLLLDHLTDPGNLGTLIRTAVAFEFDGVFLHGDTVEIFNPKTVRATMGALPLSNHWKTDDKIFQSLEQYEYDFISAVTHKGENLRSMKFGPKNVLVIGNETRGISPAVQARSTRHLSIPIAWNVESLNAAVAGSICMFSM